MTRMASTTSPSGGKLIADRYQLGELVGRGGMGGVWMAEDLKLHRRVAVKLLSPELTARPDVKERFEAEARAAARLNHPNVVSIYDSGEHEGVPFLVMELLSGRTLADEFKDGPMDQERVLKLAAQALAGLGAAHAVPIVHRDIKPGNILFTAEGDGVKVADFGIAKGAQSMDLTQTGTLLGTPAYLAPEQVAGEPATAASDLYSLGVVLFEALAGRPPHQAETVVALANKIHNEPPPSLPEVRPDINPAFAAVVEKAMAKAPGERFSSAAEMGKAVMGIMNASQSSGKETGDRTMVAPAVPADPGDRTQVISSPGTVRERAPVVERRQGGLSPAVRLAIALSVVALALIIGGVAWQSLNLADPGRPSPSPTQPVLGGSPLPAPLESSLDRLEEAIPR